MDHSADTFCLTHLICAKIHKVLMRIAECDSCTPSYGILAKGKKMKIRFILATCMLVGSTVFGQPDANYESVCSDLSREYPKAFAGTKFWGYQPYVSHPNITSNEIEAIRGFFSPGKTTPEQAMTWFAEKNTPVATHSYGGCLIGNCHLNFMRKIEESAWLVFSFNDTPTGFTEVRKGKGVKLSSVYLLRHNKKWRWIEDVLPVDRRYNARRFKNGEPDEDILTDEDVRVECDL
jgi:hypothetical protein